MRFKLLLIIQFFSCLAFSASFIFPPNTLLHYSLDRVIEVSNVELCERGNLFKGGIGYGTCGYALLAHGMESLGSNEQVINIPFAITKDYFDGSFNLRDSLGNEVELCFFKEMYRAGAHSKRFNLALDINGHASLASLTFSSGTLKSLEFYDSLSEQYMNYKNRYCEKLRDFLGALFLNELNTDVPFRVLHVLHQGDGDSSGCGYYALYTAMLLKSSNDFALFLDTWSDGKIFKTPDDDELIRYSLCLITYLHECSKEDYKSIFIKDGQIDFIFDRINQHYILQRLWDTDLEDFFPKESNEVLWRKYNSQVRHYFLKALDENDTYQDLLKSNGHQEREERAQIWEQTIRVFAASIKEKMMANLGRKRAKNLEDWVQENNYQF